jgi:hypothetical protein
MTEKENITKLQEEYPEFFEAFPLELIKFALSRTTAQRIANVCIENKITDADIVEGVAFRVTYVIFGKLPKANLFITFRDGLDIEEEKAKKIAETLDVLIFSELDKLSEEEVEEVEEDETKEEVPQIPQKRYDKDAYREPIE